jgi:putative pyruvate formate lyase activating enzyme
MPVLQPVYIEAYKAGVLQDRSEKALKALENCMLCPRKCNVNRLNGATGVCKTGRNALVASYAPHFGEEAPLVGTYGSGTIFFTHCSLGCHFCQNFDISHEGYGVEVTTSHLARIMLNLQHMGCHNINFVTPSHVVPQILSALLTAVKNGLEIPLVYNSSGYDDVETLKLLDGIVDIYMPDFKFWDSGVAKQSCGASDYPEVAREAIKEMYRQVGDLHIVNGRAVRGLLVRHLVLPLELAGTKSIVDFISREISPYTYVNIMGQYHPSGNAIESEAWGNRITEKDYSKALEYARKAGLTRLD